MLAENRISERKPKGERKCDNLEQHLRNGSRDDRIRARENWELAHKQCERENLMQSENSDKAGPRREEAAPTLGFQFVR